MQRGNRKMAITRNFEQAHGLEAGEDFKGKHPAELLTLFKMTAPRVLRQKEAHEIFKELTIYLTMEEEKRLFEAWEDALVQPGEFYSVVHRLFDKYEECEC